jgi:hypothetical protein
MATTGVHQQRRLVRVWFGEHVIVNKTADEALANRFADAMERRFAGLRVTNDPVPSQSSSSSGQWQSGSC